MQWDNGERRCVQLPKETPYDVVVMHIVVPLPLVQAYGLLTPCVEACRCCVAALFPGELCLLLLRLLGAGCSSLVALLDFIG